MLLVFFNIVQGEPSHSHKKLLHSLCTISHSSKSILFLKPIYIIEDHINAARSVNQTIQLKCDDTTADHINKGTKRQFKKHCELPYPREG